VLPPAIPAAIIGLTIIGLTSVDPAAIDPAAIDPAIVHTAIAATMVTAAKRAAPMRAPTRSVVCGGADRVRDTDRSYPRQGRRRLDGGDDRLRRLLT
jgi:hypothetical protein